MGSKGRIPPPHLRRPLPGPGMMHPDPFGPGMMHPDPYGPGIHPPPGGFPPFDMMPPPEIMEQKLATQHGEMQRLATENQRLAATHASLRQELVAAQQELQRLQSQIGAVKNEKEHRMRGLVDKIAKMEVDLQGVEPVKSELQKAQADAQSLIAFRQELISKVQQLTQDLQRTHLEVQRIPALTSELDGIRQEYHHCRATYDYEKKLYNDHLESLQVMEKNYVSMAREVEKLKAELANNANERVAGPPHGAASGYKENEEAAGQNAYADGYNIPQGRIPPTGASVPYSGGAPAAVSTAASPYGGGAAAAGRTGYDAAQRVQGYDPSREAAYDPGNVGTGGYVPQPRAHSSYDSSAARGYAVRPPLPQGQQMVAQGSNVISPYGLATPPTRPVGGGGYEPQMQQQQQQPPRGGNQSRR